MAPALNPVSPQPGHRSINNGMVLNPLSPRGYPPAPANLGMPGNYQLGNVPSPLPTLRSTVSQHTPRSIASQHDVPLVSLGCSCAAKIAFDHHGRKGETLPFDWMCTKIEGVINFLKNDFQGFFDHTNVEHSQVGPTKFTVYRGASHSWWHDDPTDPSIREKYMRRIQRLSGMQAHNTPVLFVRIAATTDELPMVDSLMQTLFQRFGRESKLLLIVTGQNHSVVGPYTIDGTPSLLVYLSNLEAHHSEAIPLGLRWVSGQQLPNCRRSQSVTSIPGLTPAHQGLFGMGGLPAFDNIPAHIPRPPRMDGKQESAMPAPPKPTTPMPMPTTPSQLQGNPRQSTPRPFQGNPSQANPMQSTQKSIPRLDNYSVPQNSHRADRPVPTTYALPKQNIPAVAPSTIAPPIGAGLAGGSFCAPPVVGGTSFNVPMPTTAWQTTPMQSTPKPTAMLDNYPLPQSSVHSTYASPMQNINAVAPSSVATRGSLAACYAGPVGGTFNEPMPTSLPAPYSAPYSAGLPTLSEARITRGGNEDHASYPKKSMDFGAPSRIEDLGHYSAMPNTPRQAPRGAEDEICPQQ